MQQIGGVAAKLVDWAQMRGLHSPICAAFAYLHSPTCAVLRAWRHVAARCVGDTAHWRLVTCRWVLSPHKLGMLNCGVAKALTAAGGRVITLEEATCALLAAALCRVHKIGKCVASGARNVAARHSARAAVHGRARALHSRPRTRAARLTTRCSYLLTLCLLFARAPCLQSPHKPRPFSPLRAAPPRWAPKSSTS